jgi:translin
MHYSMEHSTTMPGRREKEMSVHDIDSIVSAVSAQLEAKNRARETALTDSRQVVRHAANAIRALHRHEYDVARQHLETGRGLIDAIADRLVAHPDLYYAGYVQDAQKEYAEACLVRAMILGEALPGPSDVGVESAPYLNGLAEAASEMRRYILDSIRRGGAEQMRDAERILQAMDDVYTSLLTVDYPDQVTGGLRRTTDQLRAVLERTRGDLTITLRQAELEQALRERAHQ